MLNLSGLLDVQSIRTINEMVLTRFIDGSKFKTPESVILFEQGYLNREQLLEICNEQYEELELLEPSPTFIPKEVICHFQHLKCVPIQYKSSSKEIIVMYVPEYTDTKVTYPHFQVTYVPTTLHYFIKHFTRVYGEFEELLMISGRAALDMILEEAIRSKVSDLTISNVEQEVLVYYNKKKKKVLSNNIFPKYIMSEIIKVLTIGNPIADETSNRPMYVGYEIDSEYRSRVVINKTIYGYVLSIRLFSNAMFETSLEELNLNKEVIEHFRDKSNKQLNGLRLIVGETMSGKNTTALAILKEIAEEGGSKIVSIEMPVEQRLAGVEQIDNRSVDEYVPNIESLIHQNPDYVYITETKDETGPAVMRITNTGKKVLSTLHSNGVADTISRITDITGLTTNRVIQVLHTIVHQQLVRVGDEIYPKSTFVYFDQDFKQELYDKPFGEVVRLITDKERGGFKDGIL